MMADVPVLFKIYSFFGFAASLVYGIESVRALTFFKNDKSTLSLFFFGLCSSMTLYAGIYWFGIAFKGTLSIIHIKHWLWLVGILANLFYFETIVGYLDVRNKFTDWIRKISILGVTLFASFEIHYLSTGDSLIFTNKPYETASSFQILTGANLASPTAFMKLMAVLLILVFLSSTSFLAIKIFTHKYKNYTLKFGILITLISVCNEVLNATHIIDSVSIMFLSKGIEIFRVSEFFRRKNYERINALRTELQEVSKKAAMAFITSGLMHDLRNPITAILGHLNSVKLYSGSIKKHLSQNTNNEIESIVQKLENSTSKIATNIQRIQTMITSYLDLIKNSSTPKFQKLQLDDVLKGALELSESRVQNSGVKPELIGNLPTESFNGVKVQIEMIFANIINNALDATKDTKNASIKISSFIQNKSIVVRISNTGTIPDNIIKKLKGGESVTSKGDDGYGIGLRISNELCIANKSQLAIFNADNESHVEVMFSIIELQNTDLNQAS